jgi:hypothetical protein
MKGWQFSRLGWRSGMAGAWGLGSSSLSSSYNSKKIFLLLYLLFFFGLFSFFSPIFLGGKRWGGGEVGGFSGFCFQGVLGVALFLVCMISSLRSLSVQNTPCPHYSNIYILGDLFRDVKNVHPLLVSFPRLIRFFLFIGILFSYVFPKFYSSCFLGLALGSI